MRANPTENVIERKIINLRLTVLVNPVNPADDAVPGVVERVIRQEVEQ
jgi:hypothetical protein